MSDPGGYVYLYRRIWDHPVFRDRVEASVFVWMCSTAAWRDTRVRYKDRLIPLTRGQLAISSRDLARDWGWSEAGARRFLDRLKTDAMIDAACDAGVTVITICNYDKYQSDGAKYDAPYDAVIDAGPTQDRRTEQRKEGIEEKKDISEEIYIGRNRRCDDGQNTLFEGRSPLNEPDVGRAGGNTPGHDAEQPTMSKLEQVDVQFEQWWAQVPRKASKGTARRAFATALKAADFTTLMRGIMRYAAEVDGRDPTYIKHPATWLNGQCWLDEPQPPKGTANGSGTDHTTRRASPHATLYAAGAEVASGFTQAHRDRRG